MRQLHRSPGSAGIRRLTPFDDETSSQQFTAAIDAIVRF
jgi:hypothetical protein